MEHKDDVVLAKATAKYKARIQKIAKLHNEYEQEVNQLSVDMKLEKLQYSKEPDFLNSINKIIASTIIETKLEKEIEA